MTELSDAEIAVVAAMAGAEQVRRQYGGQLVRHAKGGTDFATSADLASEEAIRSVLAQHRPADSMVGEEAGRTGPADAPRRWLVDPLCGTRNFAAQTPLVAVNVALDASGRTVAAASADPLGGEVFWTDGTVAAGRRAGYLQEGDLRDNVHFAAPIAIAQAAGCTVTGVLGQPLHTEPHGLLAPADAETHAALLALLPTTP